MGSALSILSLGLIVLGVLLVAAAGITRRWPMASPRRGTTSVIAGVSLLGAARERRPPLSDEQLETALDDAGVVQGREAIMEVNEQARLEALRAAFAVTGFQPGTRPTSSGTHDAPAQPPDPEWTCQR